MARDSISAPRPIVGDSILTNNGGVSFGGPGPSWGRSFGGNLIDDDDENFDQDGDHANSAAYLAPLADYNGDGRMEMPPLAASVAFDSPTGSYRTAGVVVVTTTTDENDTPAGAEVSLREAIRDVPEYGTIVFDPALNGLTFEIGSGVGHTIGKSLTIDATSLPLGIDLTTRIQWTDGHTIALHGVHIRDVTTSINGGGIRCIGTGGTFIASHCTFSGNTTSTQGGGIYVQNGRLVLENCTLSGNAAGSRGAISLPNSTARIEFCTLADNQSAGGAIGGTSEVEFGSNVVFGNLDNSNPSDTFGAGVNFASLGYNHFEDRPAGVDPTDAEKVLTLSSQFTSLGDFGGWADTYQPDSSAGPVDFTPTIATGTVPPPEHDARGFVRVAGASADGGAHERGGASEDSDGDGLPDWWERSHGYDPDTADDPESDEDGDGATLLAEFYWRTDPNDANSFPETTLEPGPDFSFNTIPGFTYLVECSDDLINWIPEVTITATSDSYTYQDPSMDIRRFYRATRLP